MSRGGKPRLGILKLQKKKKKKLLQSSEISWLSEKTSKGKRRKRKNTPTPLFPFPSLKKKNVKRLQALTWNLEAAEEEEETASIFRNQLAFRKELKSQAKETEK